MSRHLSRVVNGRYDVVSSMSPVAKEAEANSWWRVDLAEVLSALCRHCSDLAGVLACSIVVRDRSGDFFSAASSNEWACALDDFQLSEEVGPAWECCTTGLASREGALTQRGLTGTTLAEQAAAYGITGCRSVPLSSRDETWGALTLYWGQTARGDSVLTTGIAVAAIATKALEFQYTQESTAYISGIAVPVAQLPGETATTPIHDAGTLSAAREARNARATARDARAEARDARAGARDAHAAERDARASAREKEARLGALARHRLDGATMAEQVQARRDRYVAARDRFHAKSDRAAARLDRMVSANERVESSIDGLTGAYRRDAGMLELAHEIARARRTGDAFVLAFVDVNNLKVRNDVHGHVAGDQLLRRIAETLRANVRSYDLVVRYGGDEFVCGFPALDINDAAERFARINEDLASSDEASVAFGLAELENDDSLMDLITRADALMYANRYKRASEGATLPPEAGKVASHVE